MRNDAMQVLSLHKLDHERSQSGNTVIKKEMEPLKHSTSLWRQEGVNGKTDGRQVTC